MDYRVICLTSDKYLHAIRPFEWLMNKYWPDHPEVLVAGFTPPDFSLGDGFSFHSIGNFKDYPVKKWSNALIKLLEDIPDEVFMLVLEDMWPIRKVRGDIIQMACDYMHQFRYVVRFDVCNDRNGSGMATWYGKLGEYDIIMSDPNSQYHMSLMPALWRKEHLLRVLIPDETPWDVEIAGTRRLSALKGDMLVLGTKEWPYKNTLAYRFNDPKNLLSDEIPAEDLLHMYSDGVLKRPRRK